MKLQGRVRTEQDLWRILDGSPSGIHELLDEHLPEHAVCFLSEDGAEYDSDSVVARLDVNGLLLAVMDRHDLTALSNALRGLLGRELGCFLFQLVMLLVGVLERRSHGVSLEQGYLLDQLVSRLCVAAVRPVSGSPQRVLIQHTLFSRKILKIDRDGEVIAWLRRHNELAILAAEDLLGTVLDEVSPAFYLDRYLDLSLGLGSRDVEDDAVEVGHGLIDVDRGGPEGRRGSALGGGSRTRHGATLLSRLTQRTAPSGLIGSAHSGSRGEAS